MAQPTHEMQEQITLDNVRVIHHRATDLISITAPIDVLTITHSIIQDNRINFQGNKALTDYLKSKINMMGCVFNKKGTLDLVCNSVASKEILLKTSSSVESNDDFIAKVTPGSGKITVVSDLNGLKK